MVCMFHKWDGCKCKKCGKIREVKYRNQHKMNGCTCVNCGKVYKTGHKWNHGKCEICGEINPKEGHSKDTFFKLDGNMVNIHCLECKQLIDTKSYDELYDRYLEEIENANKAGCDAPKDESYLEDLKRLKKRQSE